MNLGTIPADTVPVGVMERPKLKTYGQKPPLLPETISEQENTSLTLTQNVPNWMENLWRTTTWKAERIGKLLANAHNGTLVATGTGAIRDQWGAYYWGFSTKESLTRICTLDGPVDGNQDHMKIFRESASYFLSAISLCRDTYRSS